MTNRTHCPRKRCPAFTLVELLVVVAIISLLLAILIPSIGQARVQALRSVCASNLKQCGNAVYMYAVANDGRFISAAMGQHGGFQANIFYLNHSWGEPYEWDLRTYLEPNIGNFAVWMCPAIPGVVPIDDPGNTRFASYCTYKYFPGRTWPKFAKPGTDQWNNPKPQPVRLEDVETPARQVMMQDVYKNTHDDPSLMYFNHGHGLLIKGLITGTGDVNPSHGWKTAAYGDGANLLFYDGHVNWVGFRELEKVGVEDWSLLP